MFDSLPLDIVMLVISELLPKIQNLQAGKQKATTAGAITDFLQSVTLTDVLPPAPALYPRRFLVRRVSLRSLVEDANLANSGRTHRSFG